MYLGGYSMPHDSVEVSARRLRERVDIRRWGIRFARFLRRSDQEAYSYISQETEDHRASFCDLEDISKYKELSNDEITCKQSSPVGLDLKLLRRAL